MTASATPPVVALIGPTGIGKSQLAMRAASDHDAVIVAIDAFTVYRQMTVGTAKPSPQDRAEVPHRMVDVLDVHEDCSVQWFQQQARTAIDDARAQGRPVLLTGGSGLYFRAVVDPLEFPPTDPDVRARVQALVELDVHAAHARLQANDPAAASRIDPSNVRRITRALEVAELTGRSFSSFRTAWEAHHSLFPDLRVIGLDIPRPELSERIEQRITMMLEEGWLEECRTLLDTTLSASAAQAIGYAELMAHLQGEGTEDLTAVAERIAVRTRRFANRQRRWFATDPRVQWHHPTQAADPLDLALGQATGTT